MPDAMQLFCLSLQPHSLVCIVGGTEAEGKAIRDSGHTPVAIDYSRSGMRYEYLPRLAEQYDGIYCAHTLEHVRNVGIMLDAMHEELKDEGLLCIVVPPAKPEIVGGHLSIWNAGLLLYNLIRAHFDCKKAAVRSYDYNVAVLVRKVHADYQDNDLKEDNGDIEILARYFPFPAYQDMDGRIKEHDWSVR